MFFDYNIDMKINLKEKLNKFLDHIFVPDCKCIVCGDEITRNSKYSMCAKCIKSLPDIKNPCEKCGGNVISGSVCLNCKSNKPIFERTFVSFNYTPSISTLIYKFKYENAKYLAPYLSNFLINTYIASGIDVDYIIPVPLSKERLTERTYNQAELLCVNFDKHLNIPVKTNIVERVKDTPHQTNLSRKERLTNLEKAFKVTSKKDVKGKTILIVDDVYTTGATLNEISKVLYSSGAKCVYGLTLAHGEYDLPFETKEDKKSN